MNMNKQILLIAISVILLPHVICAQELVTGFEAGPSTAYVFISPVFSLPKSGKNMIIFQPTASFLYYKFQGSGGSTTVNSPGLAFQVGYRRQTKRLSFTIAPGIEVRWDSRKIGTGPEIKKTQTGALVGASVFFQATPLTNLNFISSYGSANRYLFTRGGIKQQITNKKFEKPIALSIGGEITGQGNREVRQYGGGGMFEIGFLRQKTSLQFRAGINRQTFAVGPAESKPYFGAGIYRRF